MTLQDRAATILDRTHRQLLLSNEIPFISSRKYVSAWLDGKKIKRSTVLAAIRYLEMAAS